MQSNNEILAELERSAREAFSTFKKGLDQDLNRFLLQKISEAEKDMEENNKKYLAKYEAEILDLNKQREEENDPNLESLWQMEEESIKRSFDMLTGSNQRMTLAFIESCKKEIR